MIFLPKLIMTGGGTAGHVTPNLALVRSLKSKGFEISYIGTEDGIEKGLAEKAGLRYFPISAGKLRRYSDSKNITDIGRIIKGYFQSLKIMKREKPDALFSKGGFVSAPVVWAAATKKIPVVIHESDITPGLANKLSMPFASKICYSFPETGKHLNSKKSVHTGLPVREELLKGDALKGLKLCGFSGSKPVIVIIGGSRGSRFLNDLVRSSLDEITGEFSVCHICGTGGVVADCSREGEYKQFEYAADELADLYAMSELVVSRAGATVLFELAELKKPNILVPLTLKASRGDQILNAESFERAGFSCVLREETLTGAVLVSAIRDVYKRKDEYIENMKKSVSFNSVEKVVHVIESVLTFN